MPPPALAAVPPAPAFPGTPQSLLLNRLEPGVTYYAMLVSRDAVGLVSDSDVPSRTPGAQAQALVFDAVPPAPANLSVVQTGRSTFTVTWSSPTAYDLDFYRLYIDSTSPYDFAGSSVVVIDSATLSVVLTGLRAGTITLPDGGRQRRAVTPGCLWRECRRRSPPSACRSAAVSPIRRLDRRGGVTLRWQPVVRYADSGDFVLPAPGVGELGLPRLPGDLLCSTWWRRPPSPRNVVWIGGRQSTIIVGPNSSDVPALIVRVGSQFAFVVVPAQSVRILARTLPSRHGRP